MPSWSLGDLKSRATRRIGRRADLSASDTSFWVNQAISDFIRDIPELLSEKTQYFSVSSGDSLLSLPNDFYEPVVLSIQTQTAGSSRTLRPISPEKADARGYYPVGTPSGYFIFNDQIQLWPSADSSANTTHASSGRSLLLRYRAHQGDLVSDSSVPSVATEHRIGILFKAEEYLHAEVGNIEESAQAGVRYLNFVSSLKDALARKQSDQVGGRISFSDRSPRHRRAGRGQLRNQDSWKRS